MGRAFELECTGRREAGSQSDSLSVLGNVPVRGGMIDVACIGQETLGLDLHQGVPRLFPPGFRALVLMKRRLIRL